MAYALHETIVAECTPPGPAAAAVVRLSGGEAFALVAEHLAEPCALLSERLRGAEHAALRIDLAGDVLPVPALLLAMPAPHSYTGEDVVELVVPGARPLVLALVRQFGQHGARHAEPGEFTCRAFLNGRIDLGQAESVERIVTAGSEAERREALARLVRPTARAAAAWRDELQTLAAEVEAVLDFDEEDLGGDLLSALRPRLEAIRAECAALAAAGAQGSAGEADVRLVLTGAVNAGKTSLANALTGGRALVSDIPGTTRDALRQTLDLGGVPVVLEDGPGFDLPGVDTMRARLSDRAAGTLAAAALPVLVLDASDFLPKERAGPEPDWPLPPEQASSSYVMDRPTAFSIASRSEDRPGSACGARSGEAEDRGGAASLQRPASTDEPTTRLAALSASLAGRRFVLVLNQIDRVSPHEREGVAERIVACLRQADPTPEAVVATSAVTGEGLDALRGALRSCVLAELAHAGGRVSLREAMELTQAAGHCAAAGELLATAAPPELIAEELRGAWQALARSLGQGYADDVLERIFSRFCIGK